MTTIISTDEILEMSARIDALLKLRRISKAQFYKDVGITAGAMSQWKAGRTSPTYNSIARIADYLGVSVAYLTGQEGKASVPEDEVLDAETKELVRCFKSTNSAGRKVIWAVIKAVASGDN